jgi:hypothetical protein
MAEEFHVGETAKVDLVFFDAQGRETSKYDSAAGVTWTNGNEAAATISDTDADPTDVEVEFTALAAEPFFLEVSADLKAGPEEDHRTFRSPELTVVEGDAVSGEVRVIRMTEITPDTA